MREGISFLTEHIGDDFACAIERWAEAAADDFDIRICDAIDYAIERLAKLDDDDFFEELSLATFTILEPYMESAPAELRSVLDDIFTAVAASTYGYRTTLPIY